MMVGSGYFQTRLDRLCDKVRMVTPHPSLPRIGWCKSRCTLLFANLSRPPAWCDGVARHAAQTALTQSRPRQHPALLWSAVHAPPAYRQQCKLPSVLIPLSAQSVTPAL
jgi:hypothetical protein